MALFGRRYQLRVFKDTSDGSELTTLSEHRVVFRVDQTAAATVDKMECTVYNPSAETIAAFQQDSYVTMEAGYTEDRTYGILFAGRVRKVQVETKGPDLLMKVTAFDAPKKSRNARLNLGLQPGTKLLDVLDLVIDNFTGVNGTTAKKTIKELAPDILWGAGAHSERLSDKTFKKGLSVEGRCWSLMTRFLKRTSPKLQWAIQDGELVIAKEKIAEKKKADAIVLGPNSGMVGSPSIGKKGQLTVTSLLQPDARPYRKVEMRDTRSVNGFYSVQKTIHKGDSRGSQWFSEVELIKVKL